MKTLAYYTVELVRPAEGWSRLPHLTAHARQASEQMRGEGIPVRFLRSIFVPEDDACFCLYEAASAEVVRDAARRADFAFELVAKTGNARRQAGSPPDTGRAPRFYLRTSNPNL